MLRSSVRRLVPYFSLLVPSIVLVSACSPAPHEVGSDDGGTTTSDECTTRAGIVCNTPNVPEGCTVGASSCSDGVIHCGQVTCPASSDGGDCSNPTKDVCHLPAISPGCTVGPTTCVGGSVQCPQITCPESTDGGTSGGDGGCGTPPEFNGIDVPQGCTEPVTCVEGTWRVGPIVCPDAGPDGSGPSVGHRSFACGKAFCNADTEYCLATPACIESPDGGTNAGSTCMPLPSDCPNNAGTCQCVLNVYLTKDGPGSASVATDNGCSLTLTCA